MPSRVRCYDCGRSFSQKFNLKRHEQRFHAADMKRQESNSISSDESSDYNQRKRKQRSSRPRCTKCGQTFSQKFNLLRHQRRFHKKDTPSEVCDGEYLHLVIDPRSTKEALSFIRRRDIGVSDSAFKDTPYLT